MTVVTVAPAGPQWLQRVRIWAAMIDRHLRPIDRMVCLSDSDEAIMDVETVGLAHRDWPREWALLELFRPLFPDGERVLETRLLGEP